MAKPTEAQLKKINQHAKELTADDTFVFTNRMIDSLPTTYHSKIMPRLLHKFVRDAEGGVGLMLVHDDNRLPFGRSFEASLVSELVDGQEVLTLYANFYIPLGLNLENGLTTDDIVKGIETGVYRDTSIGFRARKWDCSICGNDIRDWWNCKHLPGEKYIVEDEDGTEKIETCYVLIGGDGDGELLESSLVYSGASRRARVVNYSNGASKDANETNEWLYSVTNFKDIPVGIELYGMYTADGFTVYTKGPVESTGGSEQLKKRGDESMKLEELKAELAEFGLDVEGEVGIKDQLNSKFVRREDYDAKVSELSKVQLQNDSLQQENITLKEQLADKDAIIAELTAKNEELAEKAGVAQTYFNDLVDEAIKLGISIHGNAFNENVHRKIFSAMSIDELKEVISAYKEQQTAKFSGSAVAGQDRTIQSRVKGVKAELYRGDFETEEEYSEYIADKAVKYAESANISLAEATKILYKKYLKEE